MPSQTNTTTHLSPSGHTLHQLNAYWDSVSDKISIDTTLLHSFRTQLGELARIDMETGAEIIEQVLAQYLTDVASGNTTGNAMECKAYILSQLLLDKGVGETIKKSEEGYYAMAAFVLFQSFACNRVFPTKAVRLAHHQDVQDLASILLGEPQHIFSAEESPERPSQQVAAQFFPVAWCTLIEPGLVSESDVVRSVWVERPRLLHNEGQVTDPASPAPLPDGYVAAP